MTSERPKILVVSPKYFPVEEGLGHYTTEFCRHLAKVGRVAVWTSRSRGSVGKASGHPPGDVEVIDNVDSWSGVGPFIALRRALALDPDAIVLEFVPFMYSARGGINFSIVGLAFLLGARSRVLGRGKLQIMFHELWYPFSWRPKDAVMHLAHRAMVFGVSLAAEERFSATSRFADLVRRNLGPFQRAVSVLAVGSNLERERPADAKSNAMTTRPDDELRVCLFGSAHPSKRLPMVLRAIHDGAQRSRFRVRLTMIGMTKSEILAEAGDLAAWVESNVEVTGPLEASDAADRLGEQDFLVSYFQDGVSGRRGSLLAALCEGLPVVTTWHQTSDEEFRGHEFIKLLSCDEAEFAQELAALFDTPERPFSRVARGDVRAFYRRHFSWSAIVERYAELSGLAHEPSRPSP
ncbi:MAG TPA: glycosyltransferase family 4 protein [Polyangiaceae bacterium]|nr:glycosyltransferase family 4 protein [Polyangiaceae bacterium]